MVNIMAVGPRPHFQFPNRIRVCTAPWTGMVPSQNPYLHRTAQSQNSVLNLLINCIGIVFIVSFIVYGVLYAMFCLSVMCYFV
jgi:hypothetical protein